MDDALIHEMFRARDKAAETEMVMRDKAIETAMESMDTRLAGMNEFRSAMQDQSAQMATKVEVLSGLQASDAKHDAAIDGLRDKVQEMGKPNYVLLTSFLTVVISTVAALWLILGLRIDTAIAPVTLELEAMRGKMVGYDQQVIESQADRTHLLAMAEASTEADATSRSDRAQLNDRIQRLSTYVTNEETDTGSRLATLTANLVEVETQFCASDIVRNLMHATDMRMFAMLWAKVFKEAMPTDNAYYPQVCRRSTTAPNGK